MEFSVSFPNANLPRKNVLAADFARQISIISGISAKQKREREDTQDSGTIVAIILTSPLIAEFVKHALTWISRHNEKSIDIEIPGSKSRITIKNTDDISKIIKALEELK
ncbi:MAG: hypothetical protein J0I79_30815 [Mesorhizobium sp.]|uniref:hypothetical protein n=1 Tax=Mesorhizobium sp. TaxID=1871066 RepID=UPI001ACC6B84|nr:hypothetical protein [Mesorhizobium sp.]MBN9222354.1 hypothetical protein [Mesorhizobium sp.]